MLCKVGDPFFSNDNVRLKLKYGCAHLGYFSLLLLKSLSHVSVFAHFHVGLALSFLVLQRTVQ